MGLRGPGAQQQIAARKGGGTGRQAELFQLHQLVTASEPWADTGLSRAEAVITFLETLPVTAGPLAGTRFAVRPWQREIIEGIYATDDSGRRICRRALISVARGNGKSGLAAGLALAHLLGPEAEARAEVICAARTRDQAAVLFREVEAILLQTPALAARVNIQRFNKQIEVLHGPGAGGRFAVIAADARSAHGLAPSLVIIDELAQARDRELHDALMTALGKRAEPLALVISTQAGSDEHIMSEYVDHALAVAAGDVEDPRFQGFVWTAPKDCALDDPEAWAAANPGLGDLVNAEHIAQLAAEAKRMPSAEASFRQYHLNQRVAGSDAFMSRAAWAACADPGLTPDRLRGRRCVAGLDLASSRDLTAMTLTFDGDDGTIACLPYFWLPRGTIRDGAEYRAVPVQAWADAGLIEEVPGAAIDPAFVARRVAELAEEFQIERIGYDRWGVEAFRRELRALGAEVPLEAVGTGFRDQAPAVTEFERRVLDHKLIHPANPVLTWNVANLTVETDASGNRKPNKRRASERIDGASALLIALAARQKAPDGPAQPFWATEGARLWI